MYKCPECGAVFDEPEYIEICEEAEAGVASLFPNHHWTTVAVCPDCGDYGIEEFYEDEEDIFEE